MTLWQKILIVTCLPLACYCLFILLVGHLIDKLEKEISVQSRLRSVLQAAEN